MRLLRYSVIGVAVFAFFWSWLFPLRDYLFMYFLLTGTIYLGGSGAIIIGGLYWRHASTQGAWAAMITGVIVGVVGITLQAAWKSVPALTHLRPEFPLNGAWLAMVAYVCSILSFVVVSLLTSKQPFNLEKMLHRGPYSLPDSRQHGDGHGTKSFWGRLCGFNDEFTLRDRFVYLLNESWTGFWFVCFVVGTAIGLTIGIPDEIWGKWWFFTVIVGMVAAAITVVWFLIGGTRDLAELFRILRRTRRDNSDDGSVHEFDEHRDDHDVAPEGPVVNISQDTVRR
jgi:SSS family solute:Na+ symporter